MEDVKTLRKTFHKDPTKDPRTNKRVFYGKNPYNKLVEEFGDPYKKTKKSKSVKKNKKEKRERKEKKVVDIKSEIDVLGDDGKMEVLLRMEYPEIKNLCSINKDYKRICDKELLWARLIIRDFPCIADEENIENIMDGAKYLYKKLYRFFDKYTINIIKDFIEYRKNYNNLQDVYKNIFKELINYMERYFSIDFDLSNADKLVEELEKDIQNKIFKIMDIHIKEDAKVFRRPLRVTGKATDNDKWNYMNKILSDLFMDYLDHLDHGEF